MRLQATLIASLLSLMACSDESLSPPHAANTPLAAVTSPGIPFGMAGFAPSDFTPNTRPDTFWTGASITDKNLTHVQNQLAIAQTHGLRMWYNFTVADEAFYFKGGTGADAENFSLSKWKTEFDLHACPCNPEPNATSKVSLAQWIGNGILAGTYLLDDMSQFTNGTPTYNDLEAMGALAKKRFPGITTAVRQRPTELEKLTGVGTGTKKFASLDAGWAQYNSRQIAIGSYISAQNAAATRHGLKLIYGINVSDGGDADKNEVNVTQLHDWGTPMLQNPSTCTFIMWNETYSQINSPAMLNLSNLAKAHAPTPCQ